VNCTYSFSGHGDVVRRVMSSFVWQHFTPRDINFDGCRSWMKDMCVAEILVRSLSYKTIYTVSK